MENTTGTISQPVLVQKSIFKNKISGIFFGKFGILLYLYGLIKTCKIVGKEVIIKDDLTKFIPVKPNRFLYHTSNPIFRDEINKTGLIPKGRSEAWLTTTPIKGEVIFATNSDNEDDWFDSTYDDDIYKIDTSKINNKWYRDPNFRGDTYVLTFNPISRNAIELIYRGTGDSE